MILAKLSLQNNLDSLWWSTRWFSEHYPQCIIILTTWFLLLNLNCCIGANFRSSLLCRLIQTDTKSWNRSDEIFHVFCFLSKAAAVSSLYCFAKSIVTAAPSIVATGHSEPQLIAEDTRLQSKWFSVRPLLTVDCSWETRIIHYKRYKAMDTILQCIDRR